MSGVGPNAVATVEEYDPATDTWAARAPMPTARRGLGVAAAGNGRLYAIGGATATAADCCLATVEEYDPATDTWAARAPLPTARHDRGVAAAGNGRPYAIGGGPSSQGAVATVEAYAPATDTWATNTATPPPPGPATATPTPTNT